MSHSHACRVVCFLSRLSFGAVNTWIARCLVGMALAWPALRTAWAQENPPVKAPSTLERLSFDPQQAEHWDLVRDRLQLTPAEVEMFARQGLVVVNREHPSFAHAYDLLYRKDLPLLVTSDSILYAIHASLDKTTEDLEEHVLSHELASILETCHKELAQRKIAADSPWIDNYRDVDLYLSVARNLLAAPVSDRGLVLESELNQGALVTEILGRISRRQLEHPLGSGTILFGSQRHVDYSQFQPRGHYTHNDRLRQYFLAMMWLGRADCGWFVTPGSPGSGIHVDVQRELRDAVLMVDLLVAAGKLERLQSVDEAIGHFMGKSDNLTPSRLHQLMTEANVNHIADLAEGAKEEKLRTQLQKSRIAEQKIASQSFFGTRVGRGQPTGEVQSPPGLFQMLGQRFAADSWVLANVVYDTVQTRNAAGKVRKMPRGLDVMATLGHPRANELLAGDLQQWQYEPQLRQATDLMTRHLSAVDDNSSIYDLWLAALPTLHADLSAQPFFPEVMRTRPWQLKQLQTELSSWAELRHTGILYVKQSYTRNEECDYPSGYVEPYPEFYARIGKLARQTVERLNTLGTLSSRSNSRDKNVLAAGIKIQRMKQRWTAVGIAMQRLESLANKELRGEPFSAEDVKFLKDTAMYKEVHRKDSSGRSVIGTVRGFDGWYGQLLYPDSDAFLSLKPCVADVHTDGDDGLVLEVGVGLSNFIIAAIDSGPDRRVYVGPVYTYYEFAQPVSQRMTDEDFQRRLASPQPPPRPAWTEAFRVPATKPDE
jgi:hypothetical protein